jgi:hypothetical protein
MADPPAIRASDAERDSAVERLREAAVEGRLSYEELADRVDAAQRSRTRSDLDALVADLPPDGVPSAALTTAATTTSLVFGDATRSGAWLVPAESRWRTLFGDVQLDLREARVTAPEVTIHADTVFGDVDLLVPEGVVVEVRAKTLFGDIRQEAGEVAPAGAPRVILEGGTLFGDVRVRARRLRERLFGGRFA